MSVHLFHGLQGHARNLYGYERIHFGVKLTEELIWIISYFKTLAKYFSLSRLVHVRAELSLHLVRERRGDACALYRGLE